MFNCIKNYFKRKIRFIYSPDATSKVVRYHDTGILGFKLVKKYVDTKYKSYSIKILSHYEEDGDLVYDCNMLIVWFRNTAYTIKLPFKFIKPVFDYASFYAKKRDDGIIAQVRFDVIEVREFGFSLILDDDYEYISSIFIYWNHADNLLYNTRNHKGILKIVDLFWRAKQYTGSELVNLYDGTTLLDITDMGSDDVLDRVKYTTIDNLITIRNDSRAYREYTITDYDGKVITATAYINRQHYIYGLNKLTIFIMKFFKKPVIYYRYNISFTDEIGRGKETHKGGTLSMSGPIDGNHIESIPDIISNNFNIPITNIVELRK